jgi:hypothetical protein
VDLAAERSRAARQQWEHAGQGGGAGGAVRRRRPGAMVRQGAAARGPDLGPVWARSGPEGHCRACLSPRWHWRRCVLVAVARVARMGRRLRGGLLLTLGCAGEEVSRRCTAVLGGGFGHWWPGVCSPWGSQGLPPLCSAIILSGLPLGLAGAMASQMAAMVVMRSLRGGPSWSGVEPPLSRHQCQRMLVRLSWCAPWFCRWRPWCGLVSNARRAVAVVVVASSCQLLGSRVRSWSELFGVSCAGAPCESALRRVCAL